MATYVLMCTAKLGASADENEGVFDSVAWVSPTATSLPDAGTATLAVRPGDQIGFAVQVQDSGGNQVNSLLNWVSVAVSACTPPGNRRNRLADNNSPFRIGTSGTTPTPNTVLLASNSPGGPASFQPYDASGNSVSPGVCLGTQLSTIVADVPPGANAPGRPVSQYEAVITCSITDTGNRMWQFTFDPEMDVTNGN